MDRIIENSNKNNLSLSNDKLIKESKIIIPQVQSSIQTNHDIINQIKTKKVLTLKGNNLFYN